MFVMVSVDGYFEGPNHELGWHNVDEEFNEFAAKQLDEMDRLLFGWKTYEMMADYWPTSAAEADDPIIGQKMNEMPKIVFSREPKELVWQNTRLITHRVAEEIADLKNEPGKDLLLLCSSNMAVSLIEMGLLDEIRIMISPVVLGQGHTLFGGIIERLHLKLISTRTFKSGNVLLSYQPQD